MAGLPSLGPSGLMSLGVTAAPRGWLGTGLLRVPLQRLGALSLSRRARRASAIANLALMLCVAASMAPPSLIPQALVHQTWVPQALVPLVPEALIPRSLAQASEGLVQQGLATGIAPPLPWLLLLLAMSSAAASLLLLLAERERTAPATTGLPAEPALAPPPAPASARRNETAATMQRFGHDLRTPLTAIIGFSDMMQSELHGPLGSERYQSYAGHIRDSGVTLLQAIETALAAGERPGNADATDRAHGPT